MAPWIAAAAPLAIVACADLIADWPSPTPDVFVPAAMDVQSATNTATSLTTSLLSLAVGIIAGIAYLLRETPRSALRISIATAGCVAAIASIYCSYRFQSALTEQVFLYHPELERIRGRLDAQGWTLLVAGSCLASLFAGSLMDADATQPGGTEQQQDQKPPRRTPARRKGSQR